MTQAFNLSQLANNVNTSGQLNAAAGLYNQVAVANGGTGSATLTANAVLLGNGTSALQTVAVGSLGQVLVSNGTTWVAGSASGIVPVLNVFTTPGTWTKPASVKGIKVTVIAGGAPGGTASYPTAVAISAAGGGGGGGSSIRLYPAPSLPGPQPYTVGTASLASSFGVAPATVISATTGTAGGNASANYGAGGSGGVGSGGQLNMNGGSGTPGMPAYIISGYGGATIMGGPIKGVYTPPSPGWAASGGTAGSAYGGGGSGGIINNTPAMNFPGTQGGGAGATGVVIIEEFY